MAEKIVNIGIEFAYATENAVIELKKELEKYFLYQKILIVDSRYEYGDVIEKMKQQINCNFVVCRKIEENLENYDCVIAVNGYDSESIKQLAFKWKIPYMFVLTKIQNVEIFSNYAIVENKVCKFNFPIGIVLDKSCIFQKKDFICDSVIEISTMKFSILQQKLCNLFFDQAIDYDKLDELNKLFDDFSCNMLENRFGDQKLFDETANKYLSFCLKFSQNKVDVVSKLAYLFLKDNVKFQNYEIHVKYLFKLILCSLEKNYFTYYTNNFKSNVNYQKHQKYLQSFGISYSVFQIPITDSKVNFLLNEFRQKMLDLVLTEEKFDKKVKNFLADVSIDYLYKIFNLPNKTSITNYLCVEPDIFVEPSFLTLLHQQGLLNFEL